MTDDRQTGRTTAMLNQAVLRKTSNGGERVLVIVHNERMISYCRAIAHTLERRDFISLGNGLSHSDESRIRRTPIQNIFVDHTVWETIDSRMAFILDRVLS